MAITEEVTHWIVKLSDGDEQAAQALWNRYFDMLVRLARRKLAEVPRREADEEDMALSAMNSFCRGMANRKFDKVENREDLWKLLVTITARKVTAQQRRHFAAKRASGRVRGESVFIRQSDDEGADAGIGEVLGHEPTPELANMVADDCRRLLDALDDESLREVAILTLEGYTTAEIAEKQGCVRRTVQRKLERIRENWANEVLLPDAPPDHPTDV